MLNPTNTPELSRRNPLRKAAAVALFALAALAAAPKAQPAIKVLFWAGGVTAHAPKGLRDTLSTYLPSFNIQMSYRADSTNDPVWLHPDTLAQYDVMLVYTTNQDATRLGATRLANLIAWVNSGRVLVALHGSTNTYINNNTTVAAGWRGLMGGQFLDHVPNNNNGGTVSLTTAGGAHGAMVGTTMLPTSGANTGNSPYWDEGRRHQQFASDTIVLARSTIGTTVVPWIWVRPQGQGWVYYNANGHDGQVWKMLEYKTQIRRALTWGYTIKTTGIRGQAALQALVRGQGNELFIPLKTGYRLEISDMQGRRMFFRDRSSAASHDLSFLPAGTYGVNVLSETKESFRSLYIKPR